MGDTLELALQFGSIGVLVGFLIYENQRRDKKREVERAERIAVDKETNIERQALTAALTLLTEVVRGGRDRV